MLRRCTQLCSRSTMGTSVSDMVKGVGRTTKFGNAHGTGRKVNPAGRPEEEYEKQSVKAVIRPCAVVRLHTDFDQAAFLKPRLDLSRRPQPTEREAVQLYRALLKKAERQLVWTDKRWFRRMLRFEFTITSRLAEDRLDLQRCMYEKGEWLLNNDLGGLR
eukprot:TRINITY_DN3469_c2_g1_i1.p2 TRINITY_DN3469_c2_g1~~TRINITY_DN3469_c2_g1_i1.p2  ORF type:complete len:160 (+),score=26.01 TRINITY_DN3469_c2_g1_i1:66-545(+)